MNKSFYDLGFKPGDQVRATTQPPHYYKLRKGEAVTLIASSGIAILPSGHLGCEANWELVVEPPKFGELSDDKKGELLLALHNGVALESWCNSGWVRHWLLTLSDEGAYRLRPADPTVPDAINWGQVSPHFKFLARDKDGTPYLFAKKPKAADGVWRVELGEHSLATSHRSYWRGTTAWDQSLVERNNG